MAAPTTALLQDTQRLVDLYLKYDRFAGVLRTLVSTNRPIFYRGRPLKTYIYLINSLYPEVANIYNKDYKTILGSFGKGKDDYFSRSKERERELGKLQKEIEKGGYLGHLPEEDRKEVERIEEIKDRKTKKEQYEKWTPSGKTPEVVETQPAALPTTLPKIPIQISSPVKDAASFAQIQTRRLLVNVTSSDRISGLVGTVGNTILGGVGKAAGGGMNAAGTATQIAGLIPQLRAIMAAKVAASRLKYAIAGIVVLFCLIAFLPGGLDLYSKTPLFHEFLGQIAPPGSLPPGTPIYTSGDLAQCRFTRSDQNPKEAGFKSPLLLSHFQEASQVSGIPAALLAAFVRVESPSSVGLTDAELSSFFPRSSTGALGIMQIQPANTTGHDSGAVDNGAKYIGKTAATLTEADYRDVRKNILIGTGFIIHKMSYFGYYNDGKWDPNWTNDEKAINSLAQGYYGCLRYGSPDDVNLSCSDPRRIHSYGGDVWTSLQSCKPSTTTAPEPIALPDGDIKTAIRTQFGINFQGEGFREDHLRWSWEVLSLTKQTTPKFFELLGPNVTASTHAATSERKGRTIFFSTIPKSFFMAGTEAQFKVLLIHELAHIIRGDPGSTQANNYDNQMQEIIDDEGYLTKYSETTCLSGSRVDENFSEMITYFINSGTPEQDLGCGTQSSVNPIHGGSYPNHAQFVRRLFTK